MQNNYYLIKQLVPELDNLLQDADLVDCFSQNKDELVLQFALKGGKKQYIIAHLTASFTCLAFPTEFHKARKNTATLFNEIHHHQVIKIEKFLNERAFSIHFSAGYNLLFKLFGRQSNIILFKDESVLSLFKSHLLKDLEILPQQLNRPIDQSDKAIIQDLPLLKNVFPTLDKVTRSVLKEKLINLPPKNALTVVKIFIGSLEDPSGYYIDDFEGKRKFNLLKTSAAVNLYNSPIEALTSFFYTTKKTEGFEGTKTAVLKRLLKSRDQTQAYIDNAQHKFNELVQNSAYKEKADLIMAHLNHIVPGTGQISLPSFYSGKPVAIKLNTTLSAQQNAEKYYKKAKHLDVELARLSKGIATKSALLSEIINNIEKVNLATTHQQIKSFIPEISAPDKKEILPFKEFIVEGFTILVGNNAKQNDLLTLKHAKKDDLFFHAKDVAGSHVILKSKAGVQPPKYVLEKVAAIAGYYSKKRTDSYCPVGYTFKKYVRKPKNSAPGLVFVEREKVLLVKPELPH